MWGVFRRNRLPESVLGGVGVMFRVEFSFVLSCSCHAMDFRPLLRLSEEGGGNFPARLEAARRRRLQGMPSQVSETLVPISLL